MTAAALQRRDEKLNEQLVPLFDPSGRLFLASEDPVPVNRDLAAKEQDLNLKYGVNTINEIRGLQGLPPVPWGDAPWLPRQWAQTSDPDRAAGGINHSPTTGAKTMTH